MFDVKLIFITPDLWLEMMGGDEDDRATLIETDTRSSDGLL